MVLSIDWTWIEHWKSKRWAVAFFVVFYLFHLLHSETNKPAQVYTVPADIHIPDVRKTAKTYPSAIAYIALLTFT